MSFGKIYMIPVTLGSENYRNVIPEKVLEVTRMLRFFVVEDLRSARRYLRLIDREFPINETVFYVLNEHTGETEIANYLDPVIDGSDIGIMSEAGLPGIADPGAKLIALAHHKKIQVVPLTGPSSILLALISSGLNGQNFTFNGYLPAKNSERVQTLKELEKKASKGYAQIFMEAPYRNQKLFESIINTVKDNIRLCIAVNITLPDEYIRTMTISEWKKNVPSINNRPAIFILQ